MHPRGTANAFAAQTRWLALQQHRLKLMLVAHTGDLVNDRCSNIAWRGASVAMARLDRRAPYAISPGNHDVLPMGGRCAVMASSATPTSTRAFDAPGRFPPARFERAAPDVRHATYTPSSAATSAQLIDRGSVRLLVLTLPFGPTRAEVAWAARLAWMHRTRPAILVTHDFIAADGSLRGARPGQRDLPIGPAQLRGVDIYRQLVARRSNIRLVLSAHVIQCETLDPRSCRRRGVAGRATFRRADWTRVTALMANYQVRPDGGGGYLRLLQVDPSTSRIAVRTYSPTQRRQLVDSRNRFTLRGIDLAHEIHVSRADRR